jgi:pyruvate kinase
VHSVENGIASLQVLRISSKKPVLRTEKGINFPDSQLKISALSKYDRDCLPFILTNADMMGYSFVRDPGDIDDLQIELGEGSRMPTVLKIETSEAVKNLPALLFRGMKEEKLGVMIARGDLAVEIGFERLSEVQEEILWICEAAHVPVIWATQVLENMNKSGLASRSEITDAAHAAQADCVMVNKGDHVIRVLESLRDILFRSSGHHNKKRSTFRPLSIAKGFINSSI